MFNSSVFLTEIFIINESITKINSSVFMGCKNMEVIDITNSITYIGDLAFASCGSLNAINYDGTVSQWKAITQDGDVWAGIPSTTVVTCTDGTVPLD